MLPKVDVDAAAGFSEEYRFLFVAPNTVYFETQKRPPEWMVFFVVGVTGFEPATFWSRTKRATKLRYTPKNWSQCGDSDPRPADYESAALPTELHWQLMHFNYRELTLWCQDICAKYFPQSRVQAVPRCVSTEQQESTRAFARHRCFVLFIGLEKLRGVLCVRLICLPFLDALERPDYGENACQKSPPSG